MSLAEQLSSLGFSQKETKVLLASIELGPSSISSIAKKAEIKRVTVYNIIDSLLQKDFLIKVPRGKRTFYKARSPKKILTFLEERKRKFERMLPRLEALHNSKGIYSKVEFHEGKEGIMGVYEELLNTHKNIYSFASLDKIFTVMTHDEDKKLFDLLKKGGGRLYDLVPAESKELKRYDEYKSAQKLGTTKTLPKGFDFPIDITVVGDLVAFFSFSTLMVVVVRDRDIAKTHTQLFKYIWKTVK